MNLESIEGSYYGIWMVGLSKTTDYDSLSPSRGLNKRLTEYEIGVILFLLWL